MYHRMARSLTDQLYRAPIGLLSPIPPANPDWSYCVPHDLNCPHHHDHRDAALENAPYPFFPHAQALIVL